MLTLADLPPGFAKEKAESMADAGVSVTGKGADCKRLADVLRTEKPKGSTAQANASFSGGVDGPSVDESLDAMGSSTTAKAFVDDVTEAVDGCRKLTLTLEGVGTSPLEVRTISFAKLGAGRVAARFSATGGALEGFEIIQVGVHSGDILLGMTFFGLDAADAEAATKDALAKIGKKLDIDDPI